VADKISKSTAFGGFVYLIKNLGSEIRFIYDAKKRLKNLDALIICGSNQFLDNFGGPWGFPYTLLKWTLLAKSTNTKVFFVSIGAGPLSNPLSYWMLKRTLKRADYLSFRDSGSKKLIEDHIPNLNKNGAVYPDLAHSLKTVPDNTTFKKGRKTVAINPMPVFDKRYWYVSKPGKYEAYINHLLGFVKYLHGRGYTVNFFNHHPKDLLVIEDLRERLQKISGVNIDNLKKNETVQDLITTISGADIVVATRFHATVLPLRLGKPVLGICYHRKSKELLEDVGLGSYYVDISDFTSEELCTKFDCLMENIDKAKKDVESHYSRYTELMDEQWDRLVELIKNFKKNLR
jgi:polysaccharide pyruvyl transferase WcaK-like protein